MPLEVHHPELFVLCSLLLIPLFFVEDQKEKVHESLGMHEHLSRSVQEDGVFLTLFHSDRREVYSQHRKKTCDRYCRPTIRVHTRVRGFGKSRADEREIEEGWRA